MFSRRNLLVGTGALAASSVMPAFAASAQAVKPHAMADFFEAPRTRDAALSPSGKKIAVLHGVGRDDKRNITVDILDAADPATILRRIPLGNNDAHMIEWASDERLMVWVDMPWEMRTTPRTGTRMGSQKIERTIRRLMTVGEDGSNPALMFNDSQLLKTNFNLASVVDSLPDDPAHILMMAWDVQGQVFALYKVDVNSGDAELFERGRSRTYGWTLDKGVPILRYDFNPRGNAQVVYARAPGETDWKLVRKTPIKELREDFFYVGPTADPMIILAALRVDGDDTLTVREFDLRTLKAGKAVSSRTGRDVVDGLVDERNRFLGTMYIDDRVTYDFVDPSLAKHFAGINAYMGNEANVRLFDVDATQTRFLARVSGPREPGAFIFYDKAAKRLEEIGARHPQLQAERLAPTSAVKIATRDGASFTAYLTAPLSGAPGPLVVLAHGGPVARDSLEWDRQVQVLAAQGWWVLQPNFRGSGGYGKAFVQAGWRRWGDRMQEDIEDAVAQVVAEKKLDAKRVAIMGASYGGYAALMGAVRRPDLYKAAISICGVSDLPDILEYERAEDDTPDKAILKIWTDRIGDPKADVDMLVAASPRRRAAEVACPVLLVHGEEDEIVPIRQSQMMHAALKAAGKPVEFVEVANAGHGDWSAEEEFGLMTRYVALLNKAFA